VRGRSDHCPAMKGIEMHELPPRAAMRRREATTAPQ